MVLLWGRGGVWDRMCELVRDTFRALHVNRPGPAYAAGCKEWGFGLKPASSSRQRFELLGYDFMVDSNMNVWLIEVNTNPSLTYQNAWHKRQVDVMVDRLVTIVADPWFPAVSALDADAAATPTRKAAAVASKAAAAGAGSAAAADSSDEDAEDVDDGIVVSDNDGDVMDGHASDDENVWWLDAERLSKASTPVDEASRCDVLGRRLEWDRLERPLLLSGHEKFAALSSRKKGKGNQTADVGDPKATGSEAPTAPAESRGSEAGSPATSDAEEQRPWQGALGLSPIMRAQPLLGALTELPQAVDTPGASG